MRRMLNPQMIIKSQIADDKFQVDLNEILEKYGTVINDDTKTITLQIYNKEARDESQNHIEADISIKGSVVVNGSITITKIEDDVYIQGMLHNEGVFIPFIEIGSYENVESVNLSSSSIFDLYVIRV